MDLVHLVDLLQNKTCLNALGVLLLGGRCRCPVPLSQALSLVTLEDGAIAEAGLVQDVVFVLARLLLDQLTDVFRFQL